MKNSSYWKYFLNIISLVLLSAPLSNGETFVPGGNVSGTWASSGSPYYILGEITVPNGETLIIEPGIDIIFSGHFKFNIQGQIIAIGTNQDSIRFTAGNQQSGWHGIRFNYTPNTNDTSKLIYCSFSYGKANTGGSSSWDRCGGAILIGAFDKVFVSDCLFEYNMSNGDISTTVGGAVIFIKSASPSIKNSTFRNNSGTNDCSILCTYSSIYNANSNPCITGNNFLNNFGPHAPITCCYNKAIISNNFIAENITSRAGGGIFTLNTEAIITNNIIINNQCFGGEGEGGGIKCWINDKSVIINNTIAFNSATHGGGICCNQNSDPILFNNIIWGNIATYGDQVNLLENTSDPYFFYCDILGGKEGFGGVGSGTNYTGLYENNIDADPLFVSVPSNDYHLTNYSPCMEKGTDTLEIGGIWYNAPPFCFSGTPRPSPVNTKPDIGACENENLVDVEQDIKNPTEFLLLQNYPNPFNPCTKISWQNPVGGWQTIKVYDVLGNEIATLLDEYKTAGNYEVEFNPSELPSGVYFYQLQAGDYIDTKKMLLLK